MMNEIEVYLETEFSKRHRKWISLRDHTYLIAAGTSILRILSLKFDPRPLAGQTPFDWPMFVALFVLFVLLPFQIKSMIDFLSWRKLARNLD